MRYGIPAYRLPRDVRRVLVVGAGLKVWEAADVIVFKRSMAVGYAGVPNPLFYRENSQMLFGDAQERVEDLVKALTAAPARVTR